MKGGPGLPGALRVDSGGRPQQGREGGGTGSKFKFQLHILSDLGEGSA